MFREGFEGHLRPRDIPPQHLTRKLGIGNLSLLTLWVWDPIYSVEKMSLLCFSFLIWLMFTHHVFQNSSEDSSDRTKQNRYLFVFLGILELRQESFRILNPLPEGWEVTEPITLELSCHCSQIWLQSECLLTTGSSSLKCLGQSSRELSQSQSLSMHVLM